MAAAPGRGHPPASEVQGREVPKVTVEELADALALLQAKVVILRLWRRQGNELVRQEAREIVLALLQEGVHGGQRREAHLLSGTLAGQHAGAWQQGLCGDTKRLSAPRHAMEQHLRATLRTAAEKARVAQPEELGNIQVIRTAWPKLLMGCWDGEDQRPLLGTHLQGCLCRAQHGADHCCRWAAGETRAQRLGHP